VCCRGAPVSGWVVGILLLELGNNGNSGGGGGISALLLVLKGYIIGWFPPDNAFISKAAAVADKDSCKTC